MLTITQMRKSIDDLMKNIGDLRAHAVAENRELTASEETLTNECLSRIEDLEKSLKTELRLESVQSRVSRPATTEIKPDPAMNVEVRDRAQDRFFSLGEQLMAGHRAFRNNGVDPRLNTENNPAFRAISGLGVQIPSEGGFLLQPEFSGQLLERTFETGVLPGRCLQIPIGGSSLKMPYLVDDSRASGSRMGGVTAYWQNEGTQLTGSHPQFGQLEINPNRLTGLCYLTNDLLINAAALETYVKTWFANEFGFMLDDALINGNGAGKPLGILNAGCLVPVDKETGQSAATIIKENIDKMFSRLWPRSINNAAWFINQNVLPQIFSLSQAVGTGGAPVYIPATGMAGAPYGSLLGRPIVPIEQCATLGTVGDIFFADFSQYILGQRGGLRSDASIHFKFDYDETVLRFILTIDGQPGWAKYITPYKGTTDYVSPFVALATRA